MVQLGIVTNIGSNPTWDILCWVFSGLWLPWRKVHLAFQEHTHENSYNGVDNRDVSTARSTVSQATALSNGPLSYGGTLFPTLSVVGGAEQPRGGVVVVRGAFSRGRWRGGVSITLHSAPCRPCRVGVVGEWPGVRDTRCHACPHGLLVDAGCASETGRQRIEAVCTMQVFWFNTGAAWRSWSRLPWGQDLSG